MKILIIVPTLNSFNLLSKLVRSLEEQTFKNWRVIFVDGESSKSHKQWIEDLCLKNEKFSFISQSESKGIFGAMNNGIQESNKDEWVLFWGSDDWCPNPLTFELLVKNIDSNLKKNSKIDLVICKGRYFNKKNEQGRVSKFLPLSENITINETEFKKKLLAGFSPPHQGVLFSPNLLSKKNIYRDDFMIASDLEFFLRLSKEKKLRILLLNLDLVYMSDSGVSSKFIYRKVIEIIKAYKSTYGSRFIYLFFKRYLIRLKSLYFDK